MIIRNINHVRELKEEEWHVTKVKTMTITSIVCFLLIMLLLLLLYLGEYWEKEEHNDEDNAQWIKITYNNPKFDRIYFFMMLAQ